MSDSDEEARVFTPEVPVNSDLFEDEVDEEDLECPCIEEGCPGAKRSNPICWNGLYRQCCLFCNGHTFHSEL